MKNVVVYFALTASVILFFGFAYSFNPEGGDGKSIFTEKKCVTCHSVESEGIESKKKDAVDLSTVGDKFDAEFLAKYIVKEEKVDGEAHKIKMKGTEEDLKAVSEWLASLKSK
jgi:cytochrome c551/c552